MMLSLRGIHTRKRQAGVGMLEVLIAVLVVSIGFLGMAALQAKALSTNNSAMARSMATVATYSIFDAMRADLASAQAGAYNTSGNPVVADACPDAGATLASEQLHLWCEQLGSALGKTASTKGDIACNNVGRCTVTIQFDDSRAGAGGSATQKTITVTQL